MSAKEKPIAIHTTCAHSLELSTQARIHFWSLGLTGTLPTILSHGPRAVSCGDRLALSSTFPSSGLPKLAATPYTQHLARKQEYDEVEMNLSDSLWQLERYLLPYEDVKRGIGTRPPSPKVPFGAVDLATPNLIPKDTHTFCTMLFTLVQHNNSYCLKRHGNNVHRKLLTHDKNVSPASTTHTSRLNMKRPSHHETP